MALILASYEPSSDYLVYENIIWTIPLDMSFHMVAHLP